MTGYLNTSKAAKYAGVSRPTIYKWIEKGLRRRSLYGTKLIKITDLDDFIATRDEGRERKSKWT